MLTLDLAPPNASDTSASAMRAWTAAKLSELKNNLAVYFGFTGTGDIADALAMRQATGRYNEEHQTLPGDQSSTDVGHVRDSINRLGIRMSPATASVFRLLLDPGAGARLAVGTQPCSIVRSLATALQGNTSTVSLDDVRRCVTIHCSNAVTPPTATQSVVFADLDGALPFPAGTPPELKKRVAVLQLKHPLLMPGEKNSELLSVFFNAFPALELTRAIPVLNVTIYSSRQITEGGRLAAITLQKFVEGSIDVGAATPENLPLRAIGLASQVNSSLFNNEPQEFQNYSVVGLELFRASQTLVNVEAAKSPNNYLAPVIDPMRPLASLKSFSIEVKSAYGLQGTRTATLDLVLHDRSRMGEFADFLKPDRYGTSFIEVEYGWLHPDGLEVENPYADLLNLTRVRDHFSIYSSTFSFDEVGQVNIGLNCMGRGSSEITELSVIGEEAGEIRRQLNSIEELSRTINELTARVFPQPAEGTRRREIRGQQALTAAGDATNNIILSREVMDDMRLLKATLNTHAGNGAADHQQAARRLQEAIETLLGRNVGSAGRTQSVGGQLEALQSTVNQHIRALLGKLNRVGSGFADSNAQFGDAFLQQMNREVWNAIKTRIAVHKDAVTPPVAPGQRTGGNNAANANVQRAGTQGFCPVLSLGTLLTAFVAKPLAEMKDRTGASKFQEVQLYFYNFNTRASWMSQCNIAEFPVQTAYFFREYARLRMESLNRSVSMSITEFLNFVATRIVDDVMNPAYGISDLYKENQTELTTQSPVRGRTFDQLMLSRMEQYNVGRHSDFTMPQITFDIEAVPAVMGDDPTGAIVPGRTVLKIHVYDKACTANSSLRELLSASTDNLMSTLSSFPGNLAQARANEAQARTNATAGTADQTVNQLRQNWQELHNHMVQKLTEERPPMITVIEGTPPQYRFVGGPSRLKEFVMKHVPHIIYGCMGSTVKSANLSSMSDPALNTINMQRSLSASPILPNGEQAGGVPLSVYPVELTMTSLGCPFLRYGQELFVDFNTNTSVDNIYFITGLTHKIEAGTFETTIKFTANDAFGQYRSLIGQLNTASRTLAELGSTTTPTQQPAAAPRR